MDRHSQNIADHSVTKASETSLRTNLQTVLEDVQTRVELQGTVSQL
jgi:hypothetical protein